MAKRGRQPKTPVERIDVPRAMLELAARRCGWKGIDGTMTLEDICVRSYIFGAADMAEALHKPDKRMDHPYEGR